MTTRSESVRPVEGLDGGGTTDVVLVLEDCMMLEAERSCLCGKNPSRNVAAS